MSNSGFQYLEDIATGYWYSEILFAAVDLGIFDLLEEDEKTTEELAACLSCDADNLMRLLNAMGCISLVVRIDGRWINSQTASRFLVSSSHEYMGHFILYRKYMRKKWQELACKIDPGKEYLPRNNDDPGEKFYNYLRSTDSLIRLKSFEILEVLNWFDWHFPVLDIGGGAGSLLRAVIGSGTEDPEARRTEEIEDSALLELDDVITAAKRLYPDDSLWQNFRTIRGDFRTHEFKSDERFGLILVSNFLHAYGSSEAFELLKKACGLLCKDGIILIHDYFPDRVAGSPQKGMLYDLNMMINTFNGKCHESPEIISWLEHENILCTRVFDLKTDTSVIIAHGEECSKPALEISAHKNLYEKMQYRAIKAGFERAMVIQVEDIVTASWARIKCRFGCENYNTGLKCPPHGLEHNQTRELLSGYSHALILEGHPPGKEFHDRLLTLERKAFLEGYYKALAFTAGPCPVCTECPETGKCRNPELARPSMEGSGIDVYATCRAVGIRVAPVSKKGEYVKYLGLLLLE